MNRKLSFRWKRNRLKKSMKNNLKYSKKKQIKNTRKNCRNYMKILIRKITKSWNLMKMNIENNWKKNCRLN